MLSFSYDESHVADCHKLALYGSVIMPNVIILSIVMLIVMTPSLGPQKCCRIGPSGQCYKTFLGVIYEFS